MSFRGGFISSESPCGPVFVVRGLGISPDSIRVSVLNRASMEVFLGEVEVNY